MNETTVDADLIAMMRDVLRSEELTSRLGQGVDGVRMDQALWQRLDELGLTRLTLAEAAGGSGASWLEAAALHSEAAAAGVHLPLAESDLLAGWVLGQVGLEVGTAVRTVAVLDHEGRARNVPWAEGVQRVVTLTPGPDGYAVCDLPVESVQATPVATFSGQPRFDVEVSPAALPAGAPGDRSLATALMLRGALVRAVQSIGAMERVLELCVEHTTVRHQFGRPLARFQAVQHLVADIAAEVALARATVDSAVSDAARTGLAGEQSAFRVAVARSCVGHATSTVVRNAHQVHGAIGTTIEHPLQLFTQPLLDWRREFGAVGYWDQIVGTAVRSPDASVWDLITAGPSAGAVTRQLGQALA